MPLHESAIKPAVTVEPVTVKFINSIFVQLVTTIPPLPTPLTVKLLPSPAFTVAPDLAHILTGLEKLRPSSLKASTVVASTQTTSPETHALGSSSVFPTLHTKSVPGICV